MRTTLTLDDDVDAKLKAEVRRTGHSFKDVVNDLLRRALTPSPRSSALPRFEVRASPMGLRPGLSYDHVTDLIEQIEGPDHR